MFWFQYVNDMVKTSRNNMFSIIIDEATDRSSKKQLVVLATYFHINDFKPKYFLLDMVECSDGSAKGIFFAKKQAFNGHEGYLEFLSYQLDRIHSLNHLYQSDKPLLHVLKDQVEQLIKRIAEDFMEITYVRGSKNGCGIDPTHEHSYC
eukprot:gene13200-14550_t